jgi:hypothetical protein
MLAMTLANSKLSNKNINSMLAYHKNSKSGKNNVSQPQYVDQLTALK